MNTCQINKFINNYKPIENENIKVYKKSNVKLLEEVKNETINKHLKYINLLISIIEKQKMDYTF